MAPLHEKQQLAETTTEQHWKDATYTSEQREAAWTMTRGGKAPWAIIQRKLYTKNRG